MSESNATEETCIFGEHTSQMIRTILAFRLAAGLRRRQMTAAMLGRLSHHCDIVETGSTELTMQKREQILPS